LWLFAGQERVLGYSPTALQDPSTRQSACALKAVASDGRPNSSTQSQGIDSGFSILQAKLKSHGEEMMSPDTRLMFGLSLIFVPTIVYGGLTVLGVVTNRLMGSPGPPNLTATQIAFYRAGHAHAGVLTLLAMLLHIAVDYAAIPSVLVSPVRVGALAASILVTGGFFAVAHQRSLRIVLYTGAVLVAATTLTVGVGLIRSR
jgi:hypothetical protein